MGAKGTGKGLCSWCRVNLTSDNCSATTFKRLSGFCRVCAKKYSQCLYKKNVEVVKAQARNWATENPEKRKSICKKYRDSMTEEEKKTLYKQIAGLIRKAKLGITPAEFETKLISQKGLCAICKRPMISGRHSSQKACQDHNHETGKLRDILCSRCNVLIGLCSESIEILANAIKYLQKHTEGSLNKTICESGKETNSAAL